MSSPASETKPAAPTSLTAHELRYLLDLESSAAARANLRRLNLPAVADDSAAVETGAATLLVRGLAQLVDGKLRLGEIAGLVGYVLTHASTWTELALIGVDVADGALLLTEDDVTLLFIPRPLAIFDVLALRRSSGAREMVMSLAAAFLDGGHDRIAVVRADGGSGERSAAVMRTGPGRWRFAVDVPRPGSPELAESAYLDTDRASALRTLAQVPA